MDKAVAKRRGFDAEPDSAPPTVMVLIPEQQAAGNYIQAFSRRDPHR